MTGCEYMKCQWFRGTSGSCAHPDGVCIYNQDAKDAEIANLRAEVEDRDYRIKTLDACYQRALRDIVKSSRDLAAAKREYDQYKEMVGEALMEEVKRLDAALGAERGKVEKQYELIDFYDAKVAAIFKWRESAFIPNDSDEKELNRILTEED